MSLTNQVETFKRLKRELEELQLKLQPIKLELELAATIAGGTLVVGDSVVKIIEASRESVTLKEAKNKLGTALDPFIKQSFYTILKVS